MNQTREDRINWQKRIEETFAGPSGICGERCIELSEAERDHLDSLLPQLGGYTRLMDAFFDFYLQTLREAHEHTPAVNAFTCALFIATFRRFRASYKIFWDGYYNDAASHIRAVIENVLYYGAVLHKHIPLTALYQAKYSTEPKDLSMSEALKILRKHRVKLDRDIRDTMLGKKSGLEELHSDRLRQSLDVLHSHVHRAESSILEIFNDFHQRKGIRLMPVADAYKASVFVNVSHFAAWCCVRVLPFISESRRFTSDWRTRYQTLDESFSFFNDGFEGHLADLGQAYRHFIERQLSFSHA